MSSCITLCVKVIITLITLTVENVVKVVNFSHEHFIYEPAHLKKIIWGDGLEKYTIQLD